MSYPPPPAFRPARVETPSPTAWLIPVAGALALVGAFTPWFTPQVSVDANGKTISEAVDNALYSWKDGKIGLIAPILLVIIGFGVVGLMRGRGPARFTTASAGPVVAVARAAMIAGVLSLGSLAVAWFLLPYQYRFNVGGTTYEWHDLIATLQQRGLTKVEISHGPQLGFWLTAAAAFLAIVTGALMLATRDQAATTSAAPGFLPPTGVPLPGYPPPSGQPQGQFRPAAYPPSPVDERMPVYQPPVTVPTSSDDERMPVYQPPAAVPGSSDDERMPVYQPPPVTAPPAPHQASQFSTREGYPPVEH